jgi:VCBS repeat-containing protein
LKVDRELYNGDNKVSARASIELEREAAMLFNITYGANVTAQQQNAINAVAQILQNHFVDPNNPVTININVNFADITGLGASSTPLNTYTYAQIRTALINDQTTGDDGLGALPATDPIGGTHTYWMARAEAKALGLLAASTANDGTVTFDNAANLFDYNRADGITAGQFDFAGVVAHELTEIMGRTVLAGATFGTPGQPNSYELLDLYKFSGAGARVLIGTTAGYFSLDNGTTNLNDFNTVVGGDFGDWASTALVGNDSYLAFSGAGVINAVMNTDFRVMDILGYNLVNQTPTVAALSKSTGEDGPFSQSLIEGAADTDGDFLRAVNLSGSVTSASGEDTLTLGTDYTLTESTIALTAAGLTKFNDLAQGATDTAVFAYNVTDFLANVSDTLTLTISGLNDPPVANSDTGSADENETKSFAVLANDTDVDDGAILSLVSLGAVTVTSANLLVNGINAASAFTIDTNQIKFTPGTLFDHLAVGQTATALVNYTMQDEHGAQASSTLTLTVNGANDAPVIQSGGAGDTATYFVKKGEEAITKLFATDPDSGDVISFSIVGGPGANRFSIDQVTGELSLIPIRGPLNKSYLLQVQASDGQGGIDLQNIVVKFVDNKMVGDAAHSVSETFVFHPEFFSNTISNFDLAHDFLQFDKGMFSADTAAAVLAAAHDSTQVGRDGRPIAVEIDAQDGLLTILGITKAELMAHANDILFV